MECFVRNCKSKRTKQNGHMMYAFPENPYQRYTWYKACANPRKPLTQAGLLVCSRHFIAEDFIVGKSRNQHKQLRFGSVPTENLPEDAYVDFPDTPPLLNRNNPLIDLPEADSAEDKSYLDMQVLKSRLDSAERQLNIFHRVFSKTELSRILAHDMQPEEIEKILRRMEKYKSGPNPSASTDAEPVEEEVTFNEPTPVDDEDSVRRIVLDTKVHLLRLKTT